MPGLNNRLPRKQPVSRWRVYARQVLRPLFADGRQPTRRELIEAYPFGERNYTPYKIWLQEVRWFKAGCPDKSRIPAGAVPLPGQEALL